MAVVKNTTFLESLSLRDSRCVLRAELMRSTLLCTLRLPEVHPVGIEPETSGVLVLLDSGITTRLTIDS